MTRIAQPRAACRGSGSSMPGAGLRALARQSPHGLLLGAMMLLALCLMPVGTWLTLTVSGLAMGILLFLMASGMSLTFGLMNVLNLAHGAFISLGAYTGGSVLLAWFAGQAAADGPWRVPLALLAAMGLAMAVTALLGLVFERLVIRPVYGDPFKQILVTVGGAIVLLELVRVIWGPAQIPLPRPQALRGAFVLDGDMAWIGGVALEKFRLATLVLGLALYQGMQWVLKHTRLGIRIRAGVADGAMVQALGNRLPSLFLGVFVAGSALAGLGGVLWALYQEVITPRMGDELLISVIVVIVLGGLGSVRGCFHAALMVGLINLYMGYLFPPLAAVAGVGLMTGVLMWRPRGLLPEDAR